MRHPQALEETDRLIRNWTRDGGPFVECWEFEDAKGDRYTVCQDQDGEEWVEQVAIELLDEEEE